MTGFDPYGHALAHVPRVADVPTGATATCTRCERTFQSLDQAERTPCLPSTAAMVSRCRAHQGDPVADVSTARREESVQRGSEELLPSDTGIDGHRPLTWEWRES
jgi:hypothetical protein